MIIRLRPVMPCSLIAAAVIIAGCGSSSPSSSTAAAAAAGTAARQGVSAGAGGSVLAADAHSAATGDIPDNQAFLVFTDRSARYSMKYPEGWTQSGNGGNVTFRSKNNVVHILIHHAPAPSTAAVAAQLSALRASHPTLTYTAPRTVGLTSGPAVKVVYRTVSAPNPVTGKRVTLIVDRYEFAQGGRVATVDLGTPQGVDNVDAYRMMINSFHWR